MIAAECHPRSTAVGASSAAPHAEADELEHISNLLFQESPACSPAINSTHPPPMHLPTMHLPTGDSQPPSTLLGPAGDLPMVAHLTSFELPPPATVP